MHRRIQWCLWYTQWQGKEWPATGLGWRTFNVTNRSLSPQKYFPKSSLGPSSSAVMSAITSNQWGTLPLVFDGSYNCSQTHPPLGRTSAISTIDDGSLDFSCLGQLQTNSGCGDESTPWGAAEKTKSCNPFFGAYRSVGEKRHLVGKRRYGTGC